MDDSIKKSDNYISYNSIIFYFIVYIVTILCIYFIDRGLYFVQTIGLVFIFICGLLLKKDGIITLICLLIPFSHVFQLNGSYTVIPFLILIFILKSILDMSRTGLIVDKNIASAIICFFLLLCISACTALSRFDNVRIILPFFVYLLFLIFATKEGIVEDDNMFYFSAFLLVISTIISCILADVFPNAQKYLSNEIDRQYVYRFSAFSNVWDLGRELVVSISVIVSFMIERTISIFKKIICIFLILICFYFIIQTGLYSALIGIIALGWSLLFIQNNKYQNQGSYKIMMLLLIVASGVLIYFFVFENMLAVRFGAVSDNSRFEIWSQYLNDLGNDMLMLLFGVGAGVISNYAETVDRLTAHNVIIEKLIEFGIIGFTLLVIFFYQIFKYKNYKLSSNAKMVILWTFLGTCLTQGVSGNEMIFILLAICIRQNKSFFNKEDLPCR